MEKQINVEAVAALAIKLKHVPDGAAVSMPGGIEVMMVQNWSMRFDDHRDLTSKHPTMIEELLLIHRPTDTKHKGDPESEVVWHVQRHEKRIMYHILYTPEIEVKPLWNADGFPLQPNQL